MERTPRKLFACLGLLASLLTPSAQSQRPPITLDEYLSTTEIRAARISPDGQAAVIALSTPDWEHDRFRSTLWLWRQGIDALRPLTTYGHEGSPSWSPDGRWIAFTSDRPVADEVVGDKVTRIWVIAADGGEAVPLYREKVDLHAFAWAEAGSALPAIYFSVTDTPGKEQEESTRKEWKDVKRMREQEHGDVLLRLPVSPLFDPPQPAALPVQKDTKDEAGPLPAHATVVTRSPLTIESIVPAPDGHALAFTTAPVSHRVEKLGDFEIYLLPAEANAARQLTHNEAREGNLHWSPNGKQLYFAVSAAAGSAEGPYRDVQGRLYALDISGGKLTRLGADFPGSWEDFTVAQDGLMLACGLAGIEQHIYAVEGAHARQLASQAGTFGGLEAPRHGSSLLFTRSAIDEPTQVYLAGAASHLNAAAEITHVNPIFKERAQVTWKPFRWKSDDGTPVEGVLLFPPGQQDAKHLRMLTLIHGGPGDADGNRFGADWYDWAVLAASKGWLVFRPNYRGSTGYGDPFMLGISPHLVSVPGKDILTGTDALVAQGVADPDHLAIGGYSYGGYMTNWLITQTTRFKAAVTGAGAVEHAANWGNDDLTFDDAWYLGGPPWKAPDLYTSEAALFHMDKVTTPTHIVGGDADVRVSYFENVAQERALQTLGIPHTLLTFPGEGHPLANNPWHGYIKVRDELLWLDKYAGDAAR